MGQWGEQWWSCNNNYLHWLSAISLYQPRLGRLKERCLSSALGWVDGTYTPNLNVLRAQESGSHLLNYRTYTFVPGKSCLCHTTAVSALSPQQQISGQGSDDVKAPPAFGPPAHTPKMKKQHERASRLWRHPLTFPKSHQNDKRISQNEHRTPSHVVQR